jgi:hypothetical protein
MIDNKFQLFIQLFETVFQLSFSRDILSVFPVFLFNY